MRQQCINELMPKIKVELETITCTPQGYNHLVTREGIAHGADFLTVTGA